MNHNPVHANYYADQAIQSTARVLENVQIARDTFRLRFECPEMAGQILPGQFLMVRMSGMSQKRRWIFSRTVQWLLNLFLDATMYPSAESLMRAGLADPVGLAQRLRKNPMRQEIARTCAVPAVSLLKRDGLWPSKACGQRRAS